jgi:hypothetical protein
MTPYGEVKSEVAAEIVTAVAWLTSVRGDYLGLVTGNSDDVRVLPARSGLSHSDAAVQAVRRANPEGGGPALLQLLRRAETMVRRRSLIFLVTDTAQITQRLRPNIRRLLTRHQVYVILVEDMNPTIGGTPDTTLRDVDLGDLPDFLADDERLAMEWSSVIRNQHRMAVAELRSLGIRFAFTASRQGVLDALIEVLGGGRRGALTA